MIGITTNIGNSARFFPTKYDKTLYIPLLCSRVNVGISRQNVCNQISKLIKLVNKKAK